MFLKGSVSLFHIHDDGIQLGNVRLGGEMYSPTSTRSSDECPEFIYPPAREESRYTLMSIPMSNLVLKSASTCLREKSAVQITLLVSADVTISV